MFPFNRGMKNSGAPTPIESRWIRVFFGPTAVCTDTTWWIWVAQMLLRLREYGCTRVQLGLQHTDDTILKKINRGCTTQHAIDGIRRLKDAGFKVDVHLMPNLPGATPEVDGTMFDTMLDDPAMQVDQVRH